MRHKWHFSSSPEESIPVKRTPRQDYYGGNGVGESGAKTNLVAFQVPPVPPSNHPSSNGGGGHLIDILVACCMFHSPGFFFLLTLLLSLSVVLALELDSWAVCPWHVFFCFLAVCCIDWQTALAGQDRLGKAVERKPVFESVESGRPDGSRRECFAFLWFFLWICWLCVKLIYLYWFFRLYELKRKLAILLFSEREIYSQVVNQPSNNNKV